MESVKIYLETIQMLYDFNMELWLRPEHKQKLEGRDYPSFTLNKELLNGRNKN